MQIFMALFLFMCTAFMCSCSNSPNESNKVATVTDTTSHDTVAEFVKESPQVEGFTKVRVDGNFDVHIHCGKPYNVELIARYDLIKQIHIEPQHGVLRIFYEPQSELRLNENAPQINIDMPSLDRLSLEGANAVTVDKIQSKKLAIEASGSSELDLEGTTDLIDIKTEGTADVDGFGLKAKNARVFCAGAGDIELTSTESIDAKVEGAGRIAFKGSPKNIKQKIEGAGLIENKSQNKAETPAKDEDSDDEETKENDE